MDRNKRINAAYAALLAEARRRRAEALAMREAKKSPKEIAVHFGVSRQRVEKMIADALKDRQETSG